ncbi:DUF4230 domain-containing protein [Sphingomonas sp. ASV193]|uniref:DUF4230 domain-containing protein n=1 Tax=Sphingomonas sp. ASV193 TaxID=3144405 RepID=UPI0032E8D46D
MDAEPQQRLTRTPRIERPVAIGLIVLALLLGLVIGPVLGVGKWLMGGSNPETVATSALQSMRAQNRLVPFVARYVSVVTSSESRLGGLLSAQRTLILPGDVRYELDLSKLGPGDVKWNGATNTLSVNLPEIEIAGPEVDLHNAREYGAGGRRGGGTPAGASPDQANRDRAVADLRKQASAPVPMGLAREAGRQAIERSFAMPLQAAGFKDAKVVARFPGDGEPLNGEVLDHSRSYNEVMTSNRG